MKKYIAPEVEIKRFAVENIMNGSNVEYNKVAVDSTLTANDATDGTKSVSYNELFNIQ